MSYRLNNDYFKSEKWMITDCGNSTTCNRLPMNTITDYDYLILGS